MNLRWSETKAFVVKTKINELLFRSFLSCQGWDWINAKSCKFISVIPTLPGGKVIWITWIHSPSKAEAEMITLGSSGLQLWHGLLKYYPSFLREVFFFLSFSNFIFRSPKCHHNPQSLKQSGSFYISGPFQTRKLDIQFVLPQHQT